MRVLETIRRSLLPTLAVGTLLVSAPLSAQTITFSELGYNSPINTKFDATSQANWNSHFCNWNGVEIASPYKQLNWSGFSALDLQDYLYSDGQQSRGRCFVNGRVNNPTGDKLYNITQPEETTGYRNQLTRYSAVTEGNTNVLAISGERTARFASSEVFNLESMLLGAGWGNVSSLRVSGLLNGVEQWSDNYSFLGTGAATVPYVAMNKNINEVLFTAEYSTAMASFDPYNTLGEQGSGGYGINNPSRYATFWVDNITFRTPTTTVPEPATWALMASGLLGVGVAARRRRKS